MKKSTESLNSTKNQEIKDKFVNTHVYANVTDLVENSIKLYDLTEGKEGINLYEYLEPTTEFDDKVYTYQCAQEEIEEINERIDELDSRSGTPQEIKMWEFEISQLEEARENLQNLEFEDYPEPIQYFKVSSYLADCLKERGYVVIDDDIWGREAYGQAILLDGVINDICQSMEILVGQECEWKV